jgi:hypothetical protein
MEEVTRPRPGKRRDSGPGPMAPRLNAVAGLQPGHHARHARSMTRSEMPIKATLVPGLVIFARNGARFADDGPVALPIGQVIQAIGGRPGFGAQPPLARHWNPDTAARRCPPPPRGSRIPRLRCQRFSRSPAQRGSARADPGARHLHRMIRRKIMADSFFRELTTPCVRITI